MKFEGVCLFDDWCLVFKKGIRILESGLWTKGVFKFGSIVAAPFIHSIPLDFFYGSRCDLRSLKEITKNNIQKRVKKVTWEVHETTYYH